MTRVHLEQICHLIYNCMSQGLLIEDKSLEQETAFHAGLFCHILPQKECNHIIIPLFTDNCTVHQHQKL